MAKEKTPAKQVTASTSPNPETPATAKLKPVNGRPSSNKKGQRSQIGGTAVAGAKSTLPKQVEAPNSQQKQELESYNRTMRRRMQQMGTGPYAPENNKAKTVQEKRKERKERLIQRRNAELENVRRSLPGGKLATDTRKFYLLIAGVAIVIIAIIVLFVILRSTGVLK